MPSVDPSSTFAEVVAGVTVEIRELKASGVRDIAKCLSSLQSLSPVAMLDALTPCIAKYIASWSLDGPVTVEVMEDTFSVMDLVQIAKYALRGSVLSQEDKKKSE